MKNNHNVFVKVNENVYLKLSEIYEMHINKDGKIVISFRNHYGFGEYYEITHGYERYYEIIISKELAKKILNYCGVIK